MTPAEALDTAMKATWDDEPETMIGRLMFLGFAIVPIEPDEAAIERVAKAIDRESGGKHWKEFRKDARATYAAVVKET